MTNKYMRIIHRYLGFFLIGIMTVYALSGVVLIFRDSDFLKIESEVEKQLQPNLPTNQLGRELKIRDFKVAKEEGDVLFFNNGEYNKATGEAKFIQKELPLVLNKMTKLHKAKSKDPLFYLNIFFGVSLLFFAISSFWMFMPKTHIFRKGMYFTVFGMVLTFILLFL
ncbi:MULTISPECIES: hypothetical protein [Aestuariibaculum]|uniref:Peptidase n=1 Tax=Aestuariibaculum lutulentum TaxID=2920935 RepID=A0ABS9RJ40_9FLAO|nr:MULTISPECIES: hypothetical protein [Aestuariibaculum]MCH4552963.1 hypothetical protein [Aestuariibaculum lutulentum]MCR8669144.1 hypothetical protein [Aestuariibaculum sp. M13]